MLDSDHTKHKATVKRGSRKQVVDSDVDHEAESIQREMVEAEVSKLTKHHWVKSVNENGKVGMALEFDVQWLDFTKSRVAMADFSDENEKVRLYMHLHGLTDDGYVGRFIEVELSATSGKYSKSGPGHELDTYTGYVCNKCPRELVGDAEDFWTVSFECDDTQEHLPDGPMGFQYLRSQG